MADGEGEQINHHTRASELVSIFQILGNRKNMHLSRAWAEMLAVGPSSDEFYIALSAISRSLVLLRSEIMESNLRPASKDMYLGAVDSIRQYVLIENMQSRTTNELKNETDAFRLLTLLDDVLLPNANRLIQESKLKEWKTVLVELQNSAKSAFDDLTLRDFVIRQIVHLQWAVENYQYIGIDGISRAYGSTAAELARSQNMQGGQSDKSRSWYQRAKKPIVALGIAIAATSAVVEQADNLLEHGGNIYEAITDATVSRKLPVSKTVVSKVANQNGGSD